VLLPAALLAATAGSIPGGLPGPLAAVLEGVARATLLAGRHAAEWVPASGGVRPPALVWLVVALLAALALAARRPALAATWATLLGLALRCAPAAPYLPAPPRVVALDVGRGDAVVVQGRRGAVLVDGAAAHPGRFDLGRTAVLPALRALGVRRLDRVVATHADADHRGGLPAVVRDLPVEAVWLPPGGRDDPAFEALRAAARSRDVPVREVHRGSPPVRLGDLSVTPVWPPVAAPGGGRNEGSLGLRIDVASRRILLLGDVGAAEADLVRTGQEALAADVLLLPHHGSRGSSSEALLRAVDPRVALLSAPCPASRGLPHPEALARVRATSASLWWTGRDGAVFVGLAPRMVVAPFGARDDCAAHAPDAGGAP
jgi:competence protein ComEC